MKKHELNYKRAELTAGILHFGVGNFHRAHQAYYTDQLLKDDSQKNWAICGAMILDRDKQLYDRLKKQDGCYGLTVFSQDHTIEHYQIGALVELLWGGESSAQIIDKIAAPEIKIISLTITEGGYNLDSSGQNFDFSNEDIIYDLSWPSQPKTVFGYIAAGLKKRIDQATGPLTILTCDNLPHNGRVCKLAFLSFFEKADRELYEWALANVSFPNSMVDRITPATLAEDITRLEKINGYPDQAPVYCEDYIQWVIEDDFPAGRPAWEQGGVEFAQDVTDYENMKLGFVNSTHTMLSFPGYLAGYRSVDEAVQDERIASYLRQYMDQDLAPYLTPPPNTDFANYSETFMRRLLNPAVSDQLARLCADAANKFPVFFKKTLTTMLEEKADCKRIAFIIAAYRIYLTRKTDDQGASYQIYDPALTSADHELMASPELVDFLQLSCFSEYNFNDHDLFQKQYLAYHDKIKDKGVLNTLAELIQE